MPSSPALIALAGFILAAMPMQGQGAVLHLSLCGSGAPIDIPLHRDDGPAKQDGGACVLACHADVARRRLAGTAPGGLV